MTVANLKNRGLDGEVVVAREACPDRSFAALFFLFCGRKALQPAFFVRLLAQGRGGLALDLCNCARNIP